MLSIFTFTFSRLEWETNTDDRGTRGRSNNFPQKPRALSRSITWSFFAQATTAHDRCESFSCFLLLIVHTHAKLIDVVARLLTFIGCIFFLSPRYVLPKMASNSLFSQLPRRWVVTLTVGTYLIIWPIKSSHALVFCCFRDFEDGMASEKMQIQVAGEME